MIALFQAAHDAAPAGKDLLTPALTAIVVGLGTAATQWLNHRRGKKKDAGGVSAFTEIKDAIKENHLEVKAEIRDLRKTMALRIDEVEARVEDAGKDATEALHHAVGPDKRNGIRGNLEKVERRVDELEERERERTRLNVGTLVPRPL